MRIRLLEMSGDHQIQIGRLMVIINLIISIPCRTVKSTDSQNIGRIFRIPCYTCQHILRQIISLLDHRIIQGNFGNTPKLFPPCPVPFMKSFHIFFRYPPCPGKGILIRPAALRPGAHWQNECCPLTGFYFFMSASVT